ncbi:hypothetical protein JYK00_05990 [Thermosipho ferrireducens]|uniref:Uncharacterized protein n=1 Tax=Thermosipho ferrireducens TaxID=2571116 RepID=A0ABX7S7N3_9BACT|nr:hypothetical protein [Thermosipho ferrireducens]QTA37291.1 hypothetical protein JYK00_05990 [Thermosipho ferrireducens]
MKKIFLTLAIGLGIILVGIIIFYISSKNEPTFSKEIQENLQKNVQLQGKDSQISQSENVQSEISEVSTNTQETTTQNLSTSYKKGVVYKIRPTPEKFETDLAARRYEELLNNYLNNYNQHNDNGSFKEIALDERLIVNLFINYFKKKNGRTPTSDEIQKEIEKWQAVIGGS